MIGADPSGRACARGFCPCLAEPCHPLFQGASIGFLRKPNALGFCAKRKTLCAAEAASALQVASVGADARRGCPAPLSVWTGAFAPVLHGISSNAICLEGK